MHVRVASVFCTSKHRDCQWTWRTYDRLHIRLESRLDGNDMSGRIENVLSLLRLVGVVSVRGKEDA